MNAAALASLLWLSSIAPASGHAVYGLTGLPGGLLHPVAVPAHVMALVAVSLLIGQQRWGYGIPIIYAVGIAAGCGTLALGTVPLLAEETLLAATAAAALLVALGRPVLWVVGAGLTAIAGYALALDSPPEAISLSEANLTLFGTAASAAAVPVILSAAIARLRRNWQHIGIRVAASWIAASAVLVLAMRFLR